MDTADETPSLLNLARAAQNGEDRALEHLLIAVHPAIRRYLGRRLGDLGDLINDLVQETLVRIAAGISGCKAESEEQLIAWCLTVARNQGIDWLRSVRSDPVHHARSLSTRSATWWNGSDCESNEAPTSTFAALLAILRESEEILPEETRDLLYLRLAENSSWEQVGNTLDIPAGAAKRRFQRGQHRLRGEVIRRIEKLPAAEREPLMARIRRFGVSP
jgi:RNA polymerase sigma factor (sigma-70 family)